MVEKTNVFLIDSSAILSGKPLNFPSEKIITTSKIADEFQPGGKDYRMFQLLLEKGMNIYDPSESSIKFVLSYVKKSGEEKRLSPADISLLALACELRDNDPKNNPIIVTDDYSIQNISQQLDVKIQPVNQKRITKRFKWERRCRGCRITVREDVDVCPICGSSIMHVVKNSAPVRKQK